MVVHAINPSTQEAEAGGSRVKKDYDYNLAMYE